MHNAIPRSPSRVFRRAFSLLELLAAMALIGVVAAIGLARLGGQSTATKQKACSVYRNNIEVQAQLWYRNKSVYPLSNLSDIGLDAEYFPDGLPTCPVDGSAYLLDAATHKVIGHTH